MPQAILLAQGLRPRLCRAVRDSGNFWLMRILRFLLTLMLMFCLTGAANAADGDKRIAMVIGIGSYKYAPELPNPQNDARAIGAALRKLDFEVEEDYDLDNRNFASHIRDFGVRASSADV